jgi:hypothetical protein
MNRGKLPSHAGDGLYTSVPHVAYSRFCTANWDWIVAKPEVSI